MQQGREAGKLFFTRAFGQFNLVEAGLDQCAVLVIAEIIAPHAQDAPALGQRSMAERLKKGRHQLAPGKVSGSAKQYKIKRHG